MCCGTRHAIRGTLTRVSDATVFGLDLEEQLPDGWQPLEVIAIVKCLDGDGVVRLCSRYSTSLNGWEALGMLDLECSAQRALLVADFDTGEDQ